MIEILQFVAAPAAAQSAGPAADANASAGVDFSLLLGAEMERGLESAASAATAAPASLLPVEAPPSEHANGQPTADATGDPGAILDAIAAAQLPAQPQQIASLPVPAALQLPVPAPATAPSPAGAEPVAQAQARAADAGSRIAFKTEEVQGPPRPLRADASPVPFNFGPALRQAAARESGAAGELRGEIAAMPIPESQSASHLLLSHQPQHAPREPAAPRIEFIPQQLATPAWNEGFADRVTWMAKNDVQTAELRLNPADLGPIDVTLTLTGDDKSQATVQFSAAHAGTRDAIEAALPRLREMMQESGITLGQAGVDSNNSRAADGDRRQQNGNATGRPAPQPQSGATTSGSRSIGRGLVDTFA